MHWFGLWGKGKVYKLYDVSDKGRIILLKEACIVKNIIIM